MEWKEPDKFISTERIVIRLLLLRDPWLSVIENKDR